MEKTIQLFKALSDKSRLRILNSLKEGPMYVELLSQRLGLAPSTISFHLKKLEECGLVSSTKEQYYVVFSLNAEVLDSKIIDLINFSTEDSEGQKKREEQYRQNIVETFFKKDKLTSIPVQKEKRRIILEEIIKAFNIDKIYKEKDVNIILADFNDDFVTLRRELVKSELLRVNKGKYKVNTTGEVISKVEGNKVRLIQEYLFENEEVICVKTEGFVLDIKGVTRNKVKDEAIFITNRGRILYYQDISIKGFDLYGSIYSYSYYDGGDKKLDKGIGQKIFDMDIFNDNKKVQYYIIEDEVICRGNDFKIKQESPNLRFGMCMNISFSLNLDEFNEIKRKINVNLFEEVKK